MSTQLPRQLRLLTMNIEQMRAHWPIRKRQLRRLLAQETPDLVALQEVLRPQISSSSQADELGEGLGYRVCFSRSAQFVKPVPAELGNALLSRFPLREHRTELLPETPGAANATKHFLPSPTASLLYALCSVRVGLLPVYITQLPPTLAAPHLRAQLENIAQYIATEQAVLPERVPAHVRILPPVLLGDLGIAPDSAEMRFLTTEAGFVDCPSPAGAAAGRYVLFRARPEDKARSGKARLCWNTEEPGDLVLGRAGILVDLEIS